MTKTLPKLYKCISFKSPYWAYVGAEEKLRFATVDELLTGNDIEEFKHRWNSTSPAFQKLESEIRPRYDSLYSRSVTLCLGQSPNRACWDHYCSTGGVRYEFEYDPDFKSGVSRFSVAYDDSKTFSLYEFILRQTLDDQVRKMFESTDPIDLAKAAVLLKWVNSGQANDVTLEHASKEIPFKKKTEYSFEDEFRFVQLLRTECEEPVQIKYPLVDQKSSLEHLGLRLTGIATSDIDKVKKDLPQHDSKISPIRFD